MESGLYRGGGHVFFCLFLSRLFDNLRVLDVVFRQKKTKKDKKRHKKTKKDKKRQETKNTKKDKKRQETKKDKQKTCQIFADL